MASRRVRFTFPQNLITEPVIYRLGIDFEIVTNIRRADVRDDMGWVILELEGKYSFLNNKDSPSKNIGFKPSKIFQKQKHKVPMLSLSNIFEIEDLINFDKKI